jgi:hypothetical protein
MAKGHGPSTARPASLAAHYVSPDRSAYAILTGTYASALAGSLVALHAPRKRTVTGTPRLPASTRGRR